MNTSSVDTNIPLPYIIYSIFSQNKLVEVGQFILYSYLCEKNHDNTNNKLIGAQIQVSSTQYFEQHSISSIFPLIIAVVKPVHLKSLCIYNCISINIIFLLYSVNPMHGCNNLHSRQLIVISIYR